MVGLDLDGGLSGARLIDYTAPESRDRLTLEVLPTVRERGRWKGEMRLRHLQTDAGIDAFRSLFLIRDPVSGEPGGFGSVSRDLTLAKRAEAALRASEAMLAAVIEALPVGLGVTDANGRFLSLNPAGRRLHGFGDAEDILPFLEDYGRHFELRSTMGVCCRSRSGRCPRPCAVRRSTASSSACGGSPLARSGSSPTTWCACGRVATTLGSSSS
jgi:PAS domain-containing protein